ncbi:MAG TPA: GAF domain-containing protein [Bdellovibrionales bacterium]|nr:GAF domain-containing protein [Bdellovibrionales bacterium]
MQASTTRIPYDDKKKFYAEVALELKGIADPLWYTYLANASALLKQHLPDVNWVGFYLAVTKGKAFELVLGPFQGLPACVRIDAGKGVCGSAAVARKTLLVADVDAFPGHIACDSASRSEVVVPLVLEDRLRGDRLLGVLDVDSPLLARFDEQDRKGLEALVAVIINGTQWPAEFK